MSYSFNPMTEEELNQNDTIAEGIYDFEVIRADQQTSKSGNPMAKLQLTVWDKQGKPTCIFDYLVFSNVKFCMRKLKHFCDTTGIVEEYNKGQVREDLQGLSGKVHIGIQESLPNNTGGYYPEKNIVIDYISKDNVPQSNTESNPKIDEDFNDDLPF